jgi:PLP dependent protein
MDSQIADNLKLVNERIRAACVKAGRDPSEIQLIAISKTKPNSAITEAFDAGQIHFGENRVKELQQKMEEIKCDDIIWHFVGPMQTNKIKYLADRVNWIQSLYKKKHFDEIEKRLSGTGRVINTLIQVNISGEGQKQGCRPEKVPALLEHVQSLDHVRVRGLMGMATYTSDADVIRKEFRLLRNTFDENLHLNGGAVQMDQVSMGMTNDLEIAIEEGSTMVRVGTAIFGERNYQ